MKIAILITGHLRTFDNLLENNFYNNVIKPNSEHNSIDIFFHTYFDENNTCNFSTIKPTLLTYEQYKTPKDSIDNTKKRYNKLQRNFKSMTEYSLLNDINYDLIMFTRPDIYHYENLFFKQLQDNHIVHSYEKHEKGFPSDICFYGNSNTMHQLIEKFYIEKGLCPHEKLKSYNLICGNATDIIRNIVNNSELVFLKDSEM